MEDHLSKAQRYHDRAAQLRHLASSDLQAETRIAMISLAETYDRLCLELMSNATGHPSSPVIAG
jgi:hypothetical protein